MNRDVTARLLEVCPASNGRVAACVGRHVVRPHAVRAPADPAWWRLAQEWAWALLAEVSLDAAAFQEVKQWCLDEGEPAVGVEDDNDLVPLRGPTGKMVQSLYDDGELAAFEELLSPGGEQENTDAVVPQLAA